MIHHDLNDPIFLKDLLDLYDASPEHIVVLKIVVDGKNYEYKTRKKYRSGPDEWCIEFLTDDQTRVFLSVVIKEDEETKLFATSDINLTTKNMTLIKLSGKQLTHLETTFYLQTYYCKMLKDDISYIQIIDEARGVCKEDDNRENDYHLILYRIFATDKTIEDISIYSKFYNYKRYPAFTEEDSKCLDKMRSLFPRLKFLKECKKLADILKRIEVGLFRKFGDILTKIAISNVKNEDSIYFPRNPSPSKPKRRLKSPRRQMKRKSPKKNKGSRRKDCK